MKHTTVNNNKNICAAQEVVGIKGTPNKIWFVPGSINSIARNTFKIDTLQFDSSFCQFDSSFCNDIIDAKALYEWLKAYYENKPEVCDDRGYTCTSMIF